MFRPTLAMLLGVSLTMMGCGQSAGGVDICAAVARGDGMAIQRFATAGGDLNVRGSGGSTPLTFDERGNQLSCTLPLGVDTGLLEPWFAAAKCDLRLCSRRNDKWGGIEIHRCSMHFSPSMLVA